MGTKKIPYSLFGAKNRFVNRLKSNGEEKSTHLMTMMIFHFPSYDFFLCTKGKQSSQKKNRKNRSNEKPRVAFGRSTGLMFK